MAAVEKPKRTAKPKAAASKAAPKAKATAPKTKVAPKAKATAPKAKVATAPKAKATAPLQKGAAFKYAKHTAPKRRRKKVPRPTTHPGALAQAYAFPALQGLFTRRSRRFALGVELTGPLAFQSTKDPIPLSYEEEAILVAAATGITGIATEEWPFLDDDGDSTSGDKIGSFTGRAYPSPLANHNVELFWTNDDGVFALPQRDVRPERHNQLLGRDAPNELYRRAVQLDDKRLLVPRDRPNLFAFNHRIPNADGTTLFMPISDVTRQSITAMLLYFDAPHGYYLVDPHLGNDPLREFVKSGLLDPQHAVDFWEFERWQMVDANGTEQGLMIANLMQATNALGLGGHPFSGGKGRVTMGGERYWHEIGGRGPCGSLGFTMHQIPDDAPLGAGESIPVGLKGVFEGMMPPFYKNMDAAVDAVVDIRWGKKGLFTDPSRPIPWTTRAPIDQMPRPSDEAIAATKTMCNYIWETYGRFPATIDPMLMTVWYQAQHLDLDFYATYYPDEVIPDHIRNHMRDWHGVDHSSCEH
jgi:hypothetical protein